MKWAVLLLLLVSCVPMEPIAEQKHVGEVVEEVPHVEDSEEEIVEEEPQNTIVPGEDVLGRYMLVSREENPRGSKMEMDGDVRYKITSTEGLVDSACVIRYNSDFFGGEYTLTWDELPQEIFVDEAFSGKAHVRYTGSMPPAFVWGGIDMFSEAVLVKPRSDTDWEKTLLWEHTVADENGMRAPLEFEIRMQPDACSVVYRYEWFTPT